LGSGSSVSLLQAEALNPNSKMISKKLKIPFFIFSIFTTKYTKFSSVRTYVKNDLF